jgi:hypothetical protein
MPKTRMSRSLSSGAHSRDPLAHPGYEADAAFAILRKQSRHRQSPPAVGIGNFAVSSMHQHAPDKSHENSVPQAEQASWRAVVFSDRFVMNLNGLSLRFHAGFIANGAMIGVTDESRYQRRL